jgi:hypothetical protein
MSGPSFLCHRSDRDKRQKLSYCFLSFMSAGGRQLVAGSWVGWQGRGHQFRCAEGVELLNSAPSSLAELPYTLHPRPYTLLTTRLPASQLPPNPPPRRALQIS